MLLGTSIGISFLGHAAQAIIIILTLIVIQGQQILQSVKQKKYALVKRYMIQGILAFVFFIAAAMPAGLLYRGEIPLAYDYPGRF